MSGYEIFQLIKHGFKITSTEHRVIEHIAQQISAFVYLNTANYIAVGHYHNHRLASVLRNHVVKNMLGMSVVYPSFFVATDAVKQIENGKRFIAIVWCIDYYTAVYVLSVAVISQIIQMSACGISYGQIEVG